jgi:hypothetical protein
MFYVATYTLAWVVARPERDPKVLGVKKDDGAG